MKITELSIRRLQIPLKTTFSQANNTTSTSDSMILSLRTEKGILGFGESCPRPYVTGEDPSTVIEDIRTVQATLMGQDFQDLEQLKTFICAELADTMRPAALCALELALLDAWGKHYDQSVLDLLGGEYRDNYQYSAVLPMASMPTTEKLLHLFRQIGFREVKLKIDSDLALTQNKMALVKQIMGASTTIRLDVNCAWDLPTALDQIPILIEAGATNFEQIFAADQLDQLQQITETFGSQARIAVDEGLNGPDSAQRLIDEGICNQFNLKISKHGGLLATLEICRLAKKHSIGVQLGAHFGETSLLTSAGIIIASLVEELSSLEGAFGTHLLDYDITDSPLQFGRNGSVSQVQSQLNGFGLGIHLTESLKKSIS